MITRAGNILIVTFLLSANQIFSQDSLCFDQIDRHIKSTESLACTYLDTGFISKQSTVRYRECYKSDASRKTIAIETSTGSLYTRFFFKDNVLVKVETGESSNGKKINTRHYYYTSDNCQKFNPFNDYEPKKQQYLRLSTLYLDRLNDKPEK